MKVASFPGYTPCPSPSVTFPLHWSALMAGDGPGPGCIENRVGMCLHMHVCIYIYIYKFSCICILSTHVFIHVHTYKKSSSLKEWRHESNLAI